MDLLTLVTRLSVDTGEHDPPFFALADRVYAKCARFCKEIEDADAEKARQEALMRDFDKVMEDFQMNKNTFSKEPVSKATDSEKHSERHTSREALIDNIRYSLDRLTDEELERVKGYIGRLW